MLFYFSDTKGYIFSVVAQKTDIILKGRRMEELIVYAVLCSVGYEKIDEYREKLDKLFLENPQDEVLLDLEGRSYKDAMLHLCCLFDEGN